MDFFEKEHKYEKYQQTDTLCPMFQHSGSNIDIELTISWLHFIGCTIMSQTIQWLYTHLEPLSAWINHP